MNILKHYTVEPCYNEDIGTMKMTLAGLKNKEIQRV